MSDCGLGKVVPAVVELTLTRECCWPSVTGFDTEDRVAGSATACSRWFPTLMAS